MSEHKYPKTWKLQALREFAGKNKNDFVNGPFGSDLLSSELRKEGVPVVYIRDINGNRYQRKSLDCVTAAKAEKLKFCETNFGDVIVSKVGDPPCNAAVYDDKRKAIITQDVIRIRPSVEVNPWFLCMLLNSSLGRRRVYEIAIEGTRLRVSLTEFKKIHLPKPPKEEQDSIASVINNWDGSIDLIERLITTKQERRKWLMQQLLTGKRRLPKFKKSKELRKTPFGTLPADWGYPRIGDVAREVSERNGDESTRPVLSCTKHQGLVDSLTYFGKRIFSEDLSNYKIVRRGQFAYATNHIDEGSIGYQDTYDKALISPIYTVFQTNETIDDRFLFLILKTETYRHVFSSNTSASVDRRGSLRWHDFAKIHVPLPSKEEQKAIVKVIHTADREIDLLRAQLDALREQKKGLMQQLLTGKRRVTM